MSPLSLGIAGALPSAAAIVGAGGGSNIPALASGLFGMSGVGPVFAGSLLGLFPAIGGVPGWQTPLEGAGLFQHCCFAGRPSPSSNGDLSTGPTLGIGRDIGDSSGVQLRSGGARFPRILCFWALMVTVLDRRLRALGTAPCPGLLAGGLRSLSIGGTLLVTEARPLKNVSTGGGSQDGSAASLSSEQGSRLDSSCAPEPVLALSSSPVPSGGSWSSICVGASSPPLGESCAVRSSADAKTRAGSAPTPGLSSNGGK